MTVPVQMQGVWRRDSITLADGTEDRSTRVYWAQASQAFIDLRIPADRPHCRLEDLQRLPIAELAALARQKGFAGWTKSTGPLVTWNRTIDFRPPNGRPDTGIVHVNGDKLHEQGDAQSVIGINYREEYSRVADGSVRRLAMKLEICEGSPFGEAVPLAAMLIVVDGQFFFARSRSSALPAAETLEELVRSAKAERSQNLQFLLDCEVSTGEAKLSTPWIVSLSTHPWREGQALFKRPMVSHSANHLEMHWPSGVARWKIDDCNLPMHELGGLWSWRD